MKMGLDQWGGAKEAEGFSIVEICMALAIGAFCFTALLSLYAVGLRDQSQASESTRAALLITGVEADLRNTPKDSTKSGRYGLQIPAAGFGGQTTEQVIYLDEHGNGQANIEAVENSRYRLAIRMRGPANGSPMATFVNLRISWPLFGSGNSGMGGELEAVTALDRN